MKVRLVSAWGSGSTPSLCLDHFPVVVGRGNECDISVPLGFISRRHCRFVCQGDEVLVRDLESLNGTFVNGNPTPVLTPIYHGDEVRLGPLAYRVLILERDTMCGRRLDTPTPFEMTAC
jgi:pSer/pThr/pTyr-binding forkhead associated (FHA) protein